MFERWDYRCRIPVLVVMLSVISYSQNSTSVNIGSFRIEAGMSWVYLRGSETSSGSGIFGDSLLITVSIDYVSQKGDTVAIATTEKITGTMYCSLTDPVIIDSLCMEVETMGGYLYELVDGVVTTVQADTLTPGHITYTGMLQEILPDTGCRPVRQMDGDTYYGRYSNTIGGSYWYSGTMGLLQIWAYQSGSVAAFCDYTELVMYGDSVVNVEELAERLENVHTTVPRWNKPLPVDKLSGTPRRYYDFLGRSIQAKNTCAVPGIEVLNGRVQRRVPLSLVR